MLNLYALRHFHRKETNSVKIYFIHYQIGMKLDLVTNISYIHPISDIYIHLGENSQHT